MLHYVQCRQCHRFTTLWADHQGVPRVCAWCGKRFLPLCGTGGAASPAPPALLSVEDRLRNDVCRVCGCVLSLRQVIGRTCDDPQCRVAGRQAQTREMARKASQRLRHAVAVRSKARRWFRIVKQQSPTICSLHGKATGALAVLLLPANTRRLAWLPESRKRAFINELESLVSTMRQDGAHEAATPQQVDVGRPADESSERGPWEQSCALCGGCCCQSGGTTAYLRTAQIARYIQSHPGAGLDDVVRSFVSYLPAVSFEGSCVYHARRGCTLPLEMRSDVCLSFYCAEHHRVREWFQAEAEVPVLLAAVAGAKIHRIALFDGRRLRAIPLPAGIVEPPRA